MGNVQGSVLWFAKAVVDNVGNYQSALRYDYWKNQALQPLMPYIDAKIPNKVKHLKVLDVGNDKVLFWSKPKGEGWKDEAVKYVVYMFDVGEVIDFSDASKIMTVTPNTFYKLPSENFGSNRKKVIAVTALDRMSNESKAKKLKTKF